MYIIDERTPAGKALRQTAETLVNGGAPTTEWPRIAAEILDLQWQETAGDDNQVAIMTGQMPGEDPDDQGIEIVRLTAQYQWWQGERTLLYTATPMIRLQPVRNHPRGRLHGIRARIVDRLKPSSPRRLQTTHSRNPECLMTRMQQVTLEAVMRMAQGMTQQVKPNERETAEKATRTAVAAVNQQWAKNRTAAAQNGAQNVPVEVVKCTAHGIYGRCRIMMDGSHQPTQSRALTNRTAQQA